MKWGERDMKKRFQMLTAGVLLMGMLAAVMIMGSRIWILRTPVRLYYQEQLDQTDAPYTCIVVPGAGIIGSDPGIYLKDRLDTAVQLYQNGAAERIVLSGAQGKDQLFHEADVMKRYLVGCGIPETVMILDEQGTDTAHTMLHVRSIAEEGKVIVCTQELYAPRTAYLAQQHGVRAEVASSDIHIYTDGVGLARLRELLAAVKAVFDGMCLPNRNLPTAWNEGRGA